MIALSLWLLNKLNLIPQLVKLKSIKTTFNDFNFIFNSYFFILKLISYHYSFNYDNFDKLEK